jgi:putative phage-type endonuclease
MTVDIDYIREAFPNPNLEFHAIPFGTAEWYLFRRRGLGGSEIGVISGVNPYANGTKLFYQKLGIEPPEQEKEGMWHGKQLEPYLDMCWKHWDGIPGNYIENFKEKKVIRSSFKWDGYVVNKKYPWLYASPDAFIDKDGPNGGMNMVDFEPLTKHGCLELKLLSYWGEHAWEDGFPIYYILQIQTYLLICELDYAEVCILHEGNRLEVHPFYANKEIQQRILSISKKWYDHHLAPGLECKQAYDLAVKVNNMAEATKYDAGIQQYEPPPDDSESYKQYVSGIFRRDREYVKAPKGLEDIVMQAKLIREVKKSIVTKETGIRNKIINAHYLEKAEYLQYSDIAYSRYYKRKGSKEFSLDIRYPGYPSKDRVNQETSKIELYE